MRTPSIPFYANEADFAELVDWLNSDSDIAWIVRDGPRRWRAIQTLTPVSPCYSCLWHIPAGPLPLLLPYLPNQLAAPNPAYQPFKVEHVPDPWAGWTERLPLQNPVIPNVGNTPEVIFLEVRVQGMSSDDAIGLSHLSWCGHRPAMLMPAKQCTIKWWARLSRRIKCKSVKIPRQGPLVGPGPQAWAFSGAIKQFRAGNPRDDISH